MNQTTESIAKAIVDRIRILYGKDANWNKVGDYVRNGQLTIDPDGVMRFRGDPFTRQLFDRAQ